MSAKTMNLTLKVWRQAGPNDTGKLATYELQGVSPDMSFLEMIDMLNGKLIHDREDPIAFDHDCREGICGMCSMVINGTLMALRERLQLVNFICVNSMTGIQL